jgi:hypothetical protein
MVHARAQPLLLVTELCELQHCQQQNYTTMGGHTNDAKKKRVIMNAIFSVDQNSNLMQVVGDAVEKTETERATIKAERAERAERAAKEAMQKT